MKKILSLVATIGLLIASANGQTFYRLNGDDKIESSFFSGLNGSANTEVIEEGINLDQKQDISPQMYLLSSFRSDGTGGLIIGASRNASSFDAANGEYGYVPASGGLRDPSIIYHSGYYWVAYTAGVFGAVDYISIAKSSDLVTWEHATNVSVPDANILEGPQSTWAPEWFVDPDSGVIYLFFSRGWSGDRAHRIAYVTTSDFTTFSSPAYVTGSVFPDYDGEIFPKYYDAFCVKRGGNYYLFHVYRDGVSVNEIQVAMSSTSPVSGYNTIAKSGNWAGIGTAKEGESLIHRGGSNWRMFYAGATNGVLSYVDSSDDWDTWTAPANVDCGLSINHGTVISVSTDAMAWDVYWALSMRSNKRAGFQKGLIANTTPVVETFANANRTMSAITGLLRQTGTMSGARTVTLPDASAYIAGTPVTVADASGTVTSSNRITVVASGTQLLSAPSDVPAVIDSAYGFLTLVSDGASVWTLRTDKTPAASESVTGKVFLASASDVTTGTNNNKAVTPAGVQVALAAGVVTPTALAQNLISPTYFSIRDDFFHPSSTTSGSIGALGWTITGSTGAAVTGQSLDYPNPGVIRLTTGGTSNFDAGLAVNQPSATGPINLMAQNFDSYFVVRVSGTTNIDTKIGFAASGGSGTLNEAGSAGRGVFFRYRSSLGDTGWTAMVHGWSGTEIIQTGSVSMAMPSSSSFQTLRIRQITATTVGFSVNGGTQVVMSSTVGNLDPRRPSIAVSTGTNAAAHVDVDFFSLGLSGLAR